MYRIVAQDVSIAEAKKRSDCDMDPAVKKVTTENHFVLVDVQYSSKGYCALYEYNTKTGVLVLAQD